MTADSKLGVETRLGRDPKRQHHAVNPPVYHASTLAFDTVAEFEAATGGKFDKGTLYYGRYGTPTTFALEDAVAALEGGYGSIAVPSGLAAVSRALLTFAGVGDHILMTDSVYDPTRQVCDHLLKRLGVETSYYDPLIGAGIAELIRPNTRLGIVTLTPWLRHGRCFSVSECARYLTVVTAFRRSSSSMPSGCIAVSR